MKSDFYLNARQFGDYILYSGIRNNKKIRTRIPYKPSLFVPTQEESKYKTLYGENLKKIPQDSIKKAKDFIKQYESIENFHIYGNTSYEYCLISDLFPNDIEWDFSKIRVAIFDIEVNSDPDSGGFASPQDPFQPITSIALKFVGEDKFYLLGYYDFDAPDNVRYFKCKDEWTLLKTFIEIWSSEYPDIVSGWNSAGFDIPYLINRMYRILGEPETKKLSPWNFINERKSRKFNAKFNRYEEEFSYSIIGISSLDYLNLYKKYQPGGMSRESYKLDSIAEVEIGENKIEYEGSLHKLYTEDKQKFYEYNIQDVNLVEKIDEKCKLFELGLTLAYDSKTNPEDIFQQTRMWDALVYDFLKKKNIQIPQKEVTREDVYYEGAYVKPPIAGMHRWVVTLDATSLYPSIIMGKNISPETFVEPEDYTQDMRDIISKGINVDSILSMSSDLSKLKNNGVTITPNGQFFKTDKKGFLPEMVEKMFNARQEYKKKKLQAEQEYEHVITELKKNVTPELQAKKKQLRMDISKFDNLQNSKKLCLNSLYGCLGTKYFRFFDVRMAEGITLEGQLSNRWVANNMNNYLNAMLKTNKDYVIYMDTDSLMISLHDLINKVCPTDYSNQQIVNFLLKSIVNKIQPEVDNFCVKLCDYGNSYKNALSYKLEKICSNSVFVAKKRYALNVYSNEGVVYSEPKIKVTGLEIVKSSTPSVVRKALKDCVDIILNDNEIKLQGYVSEFKKKFNSLPVEDISFPRGVNGIYKYHDSAMIYKKGTPIHVKGSIMYNKFLSDNKLDSEYELIKDGDKIKFCYLRSPNLIKENVIAFPEKLPKEFDLNRFVDYNMMFDKVFMEPLKSITDKAQWDLEPKNSLEDFF
jgi:DNA polymerase elongation subunit (family B)